MLPVRRALALGLVVGALWGLGRSPVVPWALLGAGLAWLAVLRGDADRWVWGVPLIVTAAGLAPWTGRTVPDAWDLYLALTLGALLWARRPRWPIAERGAAAFLAGFTLVWALAAARTVLGPAPQGVEAFFGHVGPWNAVRVGRSLVWAIALLGFVPPGAGARKRFGKGLTAALAWVGCVVVWERLVFAGVWDTAARFRASGFFQELHTGGGALEGFLALAIPAATAWAVALRGPGRRALAGAVCLLGVYAAVVTYSRAALLAVAVGWSVVFAGVLGRRKILVRRAATLVAVGLGVVLALGRGYLADRMARAVADARARAAHWADALALVRTPGEAVLGTGLGSFPGRYLEARGAHLGLGGFGIAGKPGDRFLRLRGGRDVYVIQRLPWGGTGPWRLRLRVRARDAGASVAALVCRNNFLYSVGCAETRVSGVPAGRWSEVSRPLAFRPGDTPQPWETPALAFALFNPVPDTRIDVDDVALIDPEGRNVLANGGFEAGSERWFFLCDRPGAWHADNLAVLLAVETGAAGVLAFFGWAAVAMGMLWRRRADVFALGLLGGIAAVLAVGALNGVLEDPRVAVLVFLALGTAICRTRSTPAPCGREGGTIG